LSPMAHQRGMSMIEVMVAITLAAILLALGMPSFFTGMQNRQIRTAAEAIQNGLQIARTESLRRNRVVKFQLRPQNAWTVGCDPADATIVGGEQLCPATIQTREGSEGSANADTGTTQKIVATGAAATAPVFTDALKFTPLGRLTADTLPPGNLAVFNVTNPGAGTCAVDGGEMRCLSVVVTSGGQIRMCDPAVATGSGDPRAC
jgi:type IV fimbrial biogenesis protein FimT